MDSNNKPTTPRQDAIKLWNFYFNLFGDCSKASEGASKVVEEILKFMREDDDITETCFWANHPKSNFWLEVDLEIQSLPKTKLVKNKYSVL